MPSDQEISATSALDMISGELATVASAISATQGEALDRTVHELQQARRVFTFGAGRSGIGNVAREWRSGPLSSMVLHP